MKALASTYGALPTWFRLVRVCCHRLQKVTYMLRKPISTLLEADCVLVVNNIHAISDATGYGDEYIADRVGNIQEAIARARAVDGRVVIW